MSQEASACPKTQSVFALQRAGKKLRNNGADARRRGDAKKSGWTNRCRALRDED